MSLQAAFVRLQRDVRRAQRRDRDAGAARPAEHVADHVFGLGAAGLFEVAQHRRGQRRAAVGEETLGSDLPGQLGFYAARAGDRDAGGEGFARQRLAVVAGHDLADAGAGKAGQAGEGGQEAELFPHLAPHVVAPGEIAVGAGERGKGLLRRCGLRRLARTERETVDPVQVTDRAFGRQRHRQMAEAAEHARRAERGVERIEMAQAVEQRQDQRVFAERGTDRGDCAVEVVGLAGEDDEVDGAGVGGFGHRTHRLAQIAERAFDDDPVTRQLFGALRADEKADVLAGGGQTSTEITAGAAGAENQNAHFASPCDENERSPAGRGRDTVPSNDCTIGRESYRPAIMIRIPLHPPRWNLIVNADDFGVSHARDAGILALAAAGRIVSATLLVNGRHAVEAAAAARDSGLCLGLHLNFSEGLAPGGRSSLTDAAGNFHGRYELRRRLDAGQVVAADIDAEIRAQIERFAALSGALPLHVDGHQHVHVQPRVAVRFARVLRGEYGITRVRLPRCAGAAPATGFHAEVAMQASLAAEVFTAHGLRFPDAFLGPELTGQRFSAAAVAAALAGVRASLAPSAARRLFVELMCHPGGSSAGPTWDEFDASPERGHEAEVLGSAAFAAACAGFAPATFADLEPPPAPDQRRLLIVSKLAAASGNATTAGELAAILGARGTVLLRPLPNAEDAAAAAREIEALRDFVARERIDFVLGIHAWRAGVLLDGAFADGNPPWALLVSGTDANHDLDDAGRRASMQKALHAAECGFVLAKDLAARVAAAFPALPPLLRLAPAALQPAVSAFSLRRRLALAAAARLVLLPAGIRPVKDIRFAIAAAAPLLAEHPEQVLVIVGPTLDAAYAAACDADIAAAIAAVPGLAGRLLRIDGLPHDDYLAALAEADLLLNTSLSEGQANALCEAMVAGVPILARDIEGNRALIDDGDNGLLFADCEAFRAHWRRLFADRPFAARLAAGGRRAAARRAAGDDSRATLLAALDAIFARREAIVDLAPGARLTLKLGRATHRPDAENLELFRQCQPSAAWLAGRSRAPRCLDMGCGSGLVGLVLIERLRELGLAAGEIVFADNDAGSVTALAASLDRQRDFLAARIAGDALVACGDLFAALPDGKPFDLIVANLPQTPAPHPFRNDRYGADDGAGPLLAFLEALPRYLADDGEAFIGHIGLANPRRIAAAIDAAGWRVDCLARQSRTIAVTTYAALDPAIPPYLLALRDAGGCEFADSRLADGSAAITFAVRLLRLRRVRTGG